MYKVSMFMVNGEQLITRELDKSETVALKKLLLTNTGRLIDLSDYHPRQGKEWIVNLNNVNHITMTDKSNGQ